MDEQIVIIGANGQLGTALQNKYSKAVAVDYTELDITSKQQMENFNWNEVKYVLNAAAYTNVDEAESEEGRIAAWKINSTGVANLVSIAQKFDITLVHISTDYVFDGTNELHGEDEPYSPLSVYGASKAAGDIVVSLSPKHYVLRTSWVIGEGKNFVRTMVELAEKNVSPTVVSDQVGRLTFTTELVRAIDFLLVNQPGYGTYNVTNSGEPASWAEITREIFKLLGRDDLKVTDTTTSEYFASKSGTAPRPLKSTLDLTKIQTTGFESNDWKTDLLKYIQGD